MAEHILLMNPRKRGHRRNPRRGVVPPQLRPYLFGRRRRAARSAHRVNPRRKHHVRAHRMRSHGREVFVRPHFSNPRRRRRNPRSLFGGAMGGGIEKQLIAAGVGAVGAIALDVAWSKIAPKLPATFQSGYAAAAAEAGVALAIGYFGSKYLPRHRSAIQAGVVGAMVIVAYQVLQPLVAAKLGLSGFGAYMPGPGTAALPSPAARRMPLSDYTAYRLTGPAPGVQNAAAAIRGVMSPGVGGVAGYIPDTMG